MVPDSRIPISPLWQGAADPSAYGGYAGVIEALLPVVIICAVSLLGTAVWLVATGAHLRSSAGHRA